MQHELLAVGSLVIDRIDGKEVYGGSGPNVAVDSAMLGVQTALLSAIADDRKSVEYVKYLRGLGIDVYALDVKPDSVTYCDFSVQENGVTVDAGWYDNGLESAFCRSVVPDSVIQKAEVVHLGTCVAEFALRLSKSVLPKQMLSYNPGGWVEINFPEFIKTQPNSRFLFLNKIEFEYIQKQGYAQQPSDLLSKPEQVVIVTKGKDGAEIFGNDLYASVEALLVEPVEETGAGDAFASAFIWAYLRGYQYEKCARLASLSGAIAVQTVGGQFYGKESSSFFSQADSLGLL